MKINILQHTKTKISLVAIVGPTGSGKSNLALHLAKKFNGEIISADSRQIYKDLTIGTAKVKGRWKKKIYHVENIPHFCIDLVSPKKIFTVAEFKTCAEQAITDISTHNKLPIVVGGTGFWVDSLMYDITLPHVTPNYFLRKKLEKKSTHQLFMMLKKIDGRRAVSIEQKNPRRLIRAIEIAKAIGSTPPMIKRNPYHALWLGITPHKDVLAHSIELRARAMIRRGLFAETKKLLTKGVSKKRIREFGFEYAATLDVIEKRILPQELLKKLTCQTLAYAKRQMKWFKRNSDINWIKSVKQAERLVKKFLN